MTPSAPQPVGATADRAGAARPDLCDRPLRIAQCIHGVGLGGAQQVVKGLIETSDPQQLTHVVYCCVDGVRRAEIEAAGARVHVIPRRVPRVDPFWIGALARRMSADHVDLVHTHLFGDSLHGLLAARRRGLPVVMTLHGLAEAHPPLQRAGYRWLIPRSAAVVACSNLARDSWRRFLGEGASGIEIGAIPNGVSARASERSRAETRARLCADLGIPGDALLVAAIGRLAPQKAYRHLLEAMAGLAPAVRARCRLLVLGDGPLRSDLEARSERLGLAASTTFAGTRTDVAELLPGIDVVAFSSLVEGMPMALLEAMAAGRALVATAVGGIPEAVRDGVEALLVPPGDPAALGAALERLATDGELRRRLGESARRRFLERYTVEPMAAAYRDLYRDVLAGARGAAVAESVER